MNPPGEPSESSDDHELYESRRLGYRPEDEPEYEDEPPGALLREVRMGPGWEIAALLQTLLVGGLALWGYQLEHGDGRLSPDNRFPLEVLWNILPVISGAQLLGAVFIRLNQVGASPAQQSRGRRVTGILTLTVLAWLACRFALGVVFWSPR